MISTLILISFLNVLLSFLTSVGIKLIHETTDKDAQNITSSTKQKLRIFTILIHKKNYLLHIAQNATALQRTDEEYLSKDLVSSL
jgi:hypothetical protein